MKYDFFNENGECIKIMDFNAFTSYIKRMKYGESMDIYIKTDPKCRTCSQKLSVRKELWNEAPFFMFGGYGQEVQIINLINRLENKFEISCRDTLDSYNAVETVGLVVGKLRILTPEELHKRIMKEMNVGYKYLLVYSNEEEMITALEGKIYAISDVNGKFLCDLYQTDYVQMEEEGNIVDTLSISDRCFHSDWAIANSGVRDRVLSHRIAIVYTHEVTML